MIDNFDEEKFKELSEKDLDDICDECKELLSVPKFDFNRFQNL